MKKLSLGSIALAAMIAPAMAADMPVKAPVYKAPPPSPVYDWTGIYLGAHAGYGWGDPDSHIDWSNSVLAGGPLPPAIPADYSKRTKGFIGGGQIGFNYQTGNLVFGVEGDIAYASIKGDLAVSGILLNTGTPFAYSESQNLRWFGTARGRIGFTPASSWLIYATGGLAFGRVDAETHLKFFDNQGVLSARYDGATSTTKTGWTLGGGVEAALVNNWTAKLEYLYYDLGTVQVLGIKDSPAPFTTVNDQDVRGHIVRLGLNYRFGGPQAVVAKY
jgi:outer membrane immunogenic protein